MPTSILNSSANRGHDMQAHEAAQVVDEIVKSLQANPGQFNIRINVSTAGAVGIGGAGGPGIVGISQGGGVGFSATAAAPSAMTIQIARDQGQQQFGEQFDQMLRVLDAIKTEFAKPAPSKAKVTRLLDSLDKWVPPVIAAVIGQLAASVFAG